MSFPGILVFFVVRNLLKPMVFRICASISSSSASSLKSTSISSSLRPGPRCAPVAFRPSSRDRESLRSLLGPRGGDRAFVPLRCGDRERERSRNLTLLGALPDIYMLATHKYSNELNISPTSSILVALPTGAPLSVLSPAPISISVSSIPVAAISRPAPFSPSVLAFSRARAIPAVASVISWSW